MSFSYDCINANMHTPLAVYKGLDAKFLLESASLENSKGRYSIIVKSINFALSKQTKDSKTSYFLELHAPHKQQYNLCELTNAAQNQSIIQILQKKLCAYTKQTPLDFLAFAEILRELYPKIPQELEALPLPLGGLGYVGYEFFSECENVTFSKPKLYEAPEALLIFPKECIVFDHFYDEMHLIVSGYEGYELDTQAKLTKLKDEIAVITNKQTPKILPTHSNQHKIHSHIVYEDSKEWYEKYVNVIKDEIYKGTFLQCVLSRAVVIESNMNPLYFYETLRRNNPSPYMYYLDFTDFKIIGASPEVMLQCKNGIQTLRPIAGTRPRGKTPQEDEALAKELLADEKENAEHLMLVDLGRNDIGKNAKIGSVKLSEYKIIEKYSSVMHIVSEVSGEIQDSKTTSDCFKACFPAGTISGAPKIEAITKLEMYETHKRSIYSGAILCFMQNGDLNSAITLRSSVFIENKYYLQAGAGIVMDSDATSEYFETCNKMKALYNILMKHEKN